MTLPSSLFAQHGALIGASVRVECADLTFAHGALYCIDPASDAVVLLRSADDSECADAADSDGADAADSDGAATVVCDWRVQIIMGHSVRAIHRDEREPSGETLERIRARVFATTSAREELDSDALQRRREQLCQLLLKNFIPCEDEGDAGIAVFGGAARVRAPFRGADVESMNEQILARLQQLVAQLESAAHQDSIL